MLSWSPGHQKNCPVVIKRQPEARLHLSKSVMRPFKPGLHKPYVSGANYMYIGPAVKHFAANQVTHLNPDRGTFIFFILSLTCHLARFSLPPHVQIEGLCIRSVHFNSAIHPLASIISCHIVLILALKTAYRYDRWRPP